MFLNELMFLFLQLKYGGGAKGVVNPLAYIFQKFLNLENFSKWET